MASHSLLTVATYGSVNANAKWQVHSDQTFIDMGMNTLMYVPQLFDMHENGEIVLIVVKVTDDIFITGSEIHMRKFIHKLKQTYELGKNTHLTGSCWFFGLQVSQDPDDVIRVHADQKLSGVSSYNVSRTRRRQSNVKLNTMEKFHYNSINGSVGFIGVHALPIASFVSSYLQQTQTYATVHDLRKQSALLKKLKQLGSTTCYNEIPRGTNHFIVVVFSDAACPNENGQLGMLCGILFGEMNRGSIFHVLSWRLNLSKLPVKSIRSAETFAVRAALDETLLVLSASSVILKTAIPTTLVIDSNLLLERMLN